MVVRRCFESPEINLLNLIWLRSLSGGGGARRQEAVQSGRRSGPAVERVAATRRVLTPFRQDLHKWLIMLSLGFVGVMTNILNFSCARFTGSAAMNLQKFPLKITSAA